jgi:hypothetical protein
MHPWGGDEGDGWSPASPRRNPTGWLIGGVVVIVLVVAAALVVSAKLGPTNDTAFTVDDLTPESLPGHLLTADEVSSLLHTPAMVAGIPTDGLTADGSVAPPGCHSAWAPADWSTYQSSGYTGLARQSVLENPRKDAAVVEAIIAFPDESTPRTIVQRMGAEWQRCRAQAFAADLGNGEPVTLELGSTQNSEGITSMLVRSRSVPGPSCERAITARRNVVVDVLACSAKIGYFGSTIADEIGTRIANAR